jgi:ABC-type glycerol-3-phosphate transport system substrate-binding protein
MKKIVGAGLALALVAGAVFASGMPDKGPVVSGGVVVFRALSVFQTENPEGPAEMHVVQEFQKQNKDIKIEFSGVPMNELYAKLTALATASDLPDAFFMATEYKTKAFELGIVENLRNFFSKEQLDAFVPAALEDASVGNTLVYLPLFATPPALIYRIDWLEAKKMKPPVTWADFKAVAKAFTEDTNHDGRIDRYGFAQLGMRNGSSAGRFLYMMRTFGIRELYQKPDKTWATDIGSPKFKEMLKMFTDFAVLDKISPPGVVETGYPEAAQSFASGLTGMMITGPNAVGTIYSQNPELKGKIGSVLIPKDIQHISTFGQNGYSFNPKSKNKDAFVRWLTFFSSDSNSLYFNNISGRTPTKKSLANSPELSTPAMKGFVEALNYCYMLPEHPGFPEIQDLIGEAYQNTIANGMSIDEAASRAQQRALAVIKKYESTTSP